MIVTIDARFVNGEEIVLLELAKAPDVVSLPIAHSSLEGFADGEVGRPALGFVHSLGTTLGCSESVGDLFGPGVVVCCKMFREVLLRMNIEKGRMISTCVMRKTATRIQALEGDGITLD